MKFTTAIFVANFGLLVTLFSIVEAQALSNSITLEHLVVDGFFYLNEFFDSAKLTKNESMFAEVIVRIRKTKSEIKQFQEQTQQKLFALLPLHYLDRVSLEREQLAALKVGQALNWIADEILLYQAAISPLVTRHASEEIDQVIKSEKAKLANIEILGVEAQKLLDAGLQQNETARVHTNQLIQHKLDQIISDAQSTSDKFVHQYVAEMLKFNRKTNQGLNLLQKFHVAQITSMLSYYADYAKSLKEVIPKLLE